MEENNKDLEVNKIQYGVWVIDGDIAYWQLYDTIESAVDENGECEVYKLRAKSIGTWARDVIQVKK